MVRTERALLPLLMLLFACTAEDAELPPPEFRYRVLGEEFIHDDQAIALRYADGAVGIYSSYPPDDRLHVFLPELREGEQELSATTYATARVRDPRFSLGFLYGYSNGAPDRQGFVRIDAYDPAQALLSGAFSFIARPPGGTAAAIVKEGRFERLRLVDVAARYSGGTAALRLDEVDYATSNVDLEVASAYLECRIDFGPAAGAVFMHVPLSMDPGEHRLGSDLNDLGEAYFEYDPPAGGAGTLVDSLSTIELRTLDRTARRLEATVSATYLTPSATRVIHLTDLTLRWD